MKNVSLLFFRTALSRYGQLLGLLLLAGFTHRAQASSPIGVSSPANGSVVTTANPSYAGFVSDPNSPVNVFVDGAPIGSAFADASGNWFLPPAPTPLANGPHTVYASGVICGCQSVTNGFLVNTTPPPPTLQTGPARPGTVTTTTASIDGFVIDGDPITGRGVVYSRTNNSPTIGGSGTTQVSNGSGSGSFLTALSGLTPGTTYFYTVYATNNSGTGYGSVRTFTTTAITITIAPTGLPAGTVGTAYSQTFTASGGTAPYRYAVTTGSLPAGLTLSISGVLSGTPTASGPSSFQVTATDAANYTGTQSYVLAINAAANSTWTGAAGTTNWFTSGNWSAGVPAATTSVVIPAGLSLYPSIASGTASVRNLTINTGAMLTMNVASTTLDVRGNLTNNGTFQPTDGTVVLGTTTLSSLLGSVGVRFWNLTVNGSAAQVSTSAGASVRRLLALNGNLNTNGNPFALESDATLTALVVNNSGVLNGNATVQRYISPDRYAAAAYRHLASPVSGAAVSSLATATFTPVVNAAFNTSAAPGSVTPFPTVQAYDQARLATATNNLTAFDKGWYSPTALSDALTPGRGYTVNIAADQTVNFVGTPTTGVVAMNVNRNVGTTAPDAGWQFLGNPYPAPLNYSLVAAADRSNLDGAIYVYEASSQYGGVYRTYLPAVGASAAIGNPILAQGQGFFARVSDGQASGSLTFRNSQRVTSYQNPVFHRSTADARPQVQLTLQGATGPADALHVYFDAAATAGVDAQLDAMKLANPSGLNLSAEAAGQQLAINGLPTLGAASVTVPLQVRVPATGTYTLAATQLQNLGATPAYLRDRQTGTLVNLAVQPRYTFTLNAANTAARFELVFAPQGALATTSASLNAQVAVFPNPAHTAAFVELPTSVSRSAATAALVDALGRTVRTFALPAGLSTHALPLAEVAAGVYSVRVATAQGTITKKLVVE